MKMPLNASQTIAVVAIAIALAAGAYALGRSAQPEPLAAAETAQPRPNKLTAAPAPAHTPARVATPVVDNNPAPARICDECYRVVGVRSEERKGSGSGLGAVGGALIGGLLGNQIGGGTGKKIATVGGAVAGGMAGNEIERRNKSERVWIVQMVNRDGGSQSHQQSHDPEVRNGDVVVLRDGQIQRR